jgi:hypothetical protein
MTRTVATVYHAAALLDDLTITARQIVSELRNDPQDHAYAKVYWLRRELSRIVATLGEGVPPGFGSISEYLDHIGE